MSTTPEETALYPKVVNFELEPHYSRHVSGMTEFGLHAKADIAEQLAWRDKKLEALASELAATKAEIALWKERMSIVNAAQDEQRLELDRTREDLSDTHNCWEKDRLRAESAELRLGEAEKALGPYLESVRRVAVHGGHFVLTSRECDELLALIAAWREGK